MFSALQPLAARWAARNVLTFSARRTVHTATKPRRTAWRPLAWGAAFAVTASTAAAVHLDAPEESNTIADPATNIQFPKTLRIPSKFPLPEFSLVGIGVRTVSFLGIKVYSIGFYADLANPSLKIPQSATPEEKIEHIIRNTACVIRIVPTRSTSYSHLRDGFMRTFTARINIAKECKTLTQEQERNVQSPLRQFKSMFPNTPLTKNTPMDILLTAPSEKRQRALIIRDLGAVDSTWIVEEFLLAYFEGDGISPPLKMSVVDHLDSFGQ